MSSDPPTPRPPSTLHALYQPPPSPSPRRARTASLQSLIDANPHYGFCAATGDALASAPSLKDLRRNSAGSRTAMGARRGSSVSAASPGVGGVGRSGSFPIHEHEYEEEELGRGRAAAAAADKDKDGDGGGGGGGGGGVVEKGEEEKEHNPGWWAVTVQGLLSFWKFFITPLGFCITIYMLNIVAWGGMLFLLLVNAAPAMCKPSCNAIDSPRRIWIEIDSQILNALFCVTGFGLIPWRFRDLYFLLKWRVAGQKAALVRLAQIHDGWFRVPAEVGQGETVTGERAPPTKSWKMDFVVWLYVWNTFLQAVLSGFMWGMNRIERPSWSTGLFVALACIVAGVAGGMVWWEGRKVKRIEGVEEKEEGKRGEKRAEEIVEV
ncbi:uncharacterized protein LAJ45_00015 [Morchella importuna]|uniref:uncharacterized protein n=1 Tax=Morchella importuna TaxID=1174673 RepID=UPI001E8DC482|nr:uncharacterized protein LAJ45_00015 [Morchella importuna]KAH8155007.1 hypothetical protein LAJ45_00015 [Morchella importuna]